MASPITLTLDSDRRPEQLADLVRDFVSDLRRERTLNAEPVTVAPLAGERAGDVTLLGQVVLTFLSAGAATALIGCLKAYLERDRSLRIRVKKADGTEFELDGKHFDSKQLDETVRTLQRLAAS